MGSKLFLALTTCEYTQLIKTVRALFLLELLYYPLNISVTQPLTTLFIYSRLVL